MSGAICKGCGKAEVRDWRFLCKTCKRIREQGRKCSWCGGVPQPPGLFCADCKAERRKEKVEYVRQRRLSFLAAGLCYECGKSDPVEGYRLCEKCSRSKSDRRNALDRRRRKEGLCVQCGKRRPSKKGLSRCKGCEAKRREYQKNSLPRPDGRRGSRQGKFSQMCEECGKRPPASGFNRCEDCLLKKVDESVRTRNLGANEGVEP